MSNIQPFNLYTSKKFTNFLASIESVSDPRIDRRKSHPLINIIVITVFAILGGANNPSAIERFGWRHCDWFDLILDLKHGIPSHDTIMRLLRFIEADELNFWLQFWISEEIDKDDQAHIAIDGKEDNANQFYCMRAFDVKNNRVLTHARVPDENNEITIAPLILRKINVKNAIITGDAIYTQKKIVRYIASQRADYVLALKKNQHDFYDDIALYLNNIEDDPRQEGTYDKLTMTEKSRGRIVKRTIISTDRIDWLHNRSKWKKLRSITVIKTIVYSKTKIYRSIRYFISSMKAHAKSIGKLIRDHWSIENQCHRNLDINFDSDRSTIRDYNASICLSILKDFALYLLQRRDSKTSLREKRIANDHLFHEALKTIVNPGF
jgi:predicted transposase YbfD/YdcC